MENIERIRELLEELKRNPINCQSRRKTFMDVTRYPHLENVVSNLLAFFFDDSEEHGMGSLWLDSLLSLRKIDTCESNITVQREYYTENRKRIDLLIESDNYVVCIENKIYADLTNDLKEYKDTVCKKYEGKKKEPVFLVLSLNPLPKNLMCESFVNITYLDLFEAVRSRLGGYLDKCDNTWLLFMKDFMATIERMCGGSMVNTTEFEFLFRDYYQEIKRIENLKSDYIKAIKTEAGNVCDAVSDNKSKINSGGNKKVEIYSYEGKAETRTSIVIDINFDTDKKRCLTVETSRDSWGWHISLMARRETTELVNALLSGDCFEEKRHPAQETEGSLITPFYGTHHIIQNFDAQVSVEDLVNEIICTTNKVITEVDRTEKKKD